MRKLEFGERELLAQGVTRRKATGSHPAVCPGGFEVRPRPAGDQGPAREEEGAQPAQLQLRPGVVRTSRLPTASWPLPHEGRQPGCQPAVTHHPPPPGTVRAFPSRSPRSPIPSFSFFLSFAEGEPGRPRKVEA